MLLAVLLHLLIFHLLTASDASLHTDTEYKIKQVDTCPDAGYFLKREATANALEPNVCYLCFCQGDHTAVCWKRDNRRCSKESFHYHGVAKRNTRMKRSPAFTDIFFRDASRDLFNRNSKTQCKPYESSFSDDCPPADWCTGCTVCDCDANGRWDCHLLSFCPDDKKKSKNRRQMPPGLWGPNRHGDPRTPPPGSWLPPGILRNKKSKLSKNSVKLPKKKTIPVKKFQVAKKAKNKTKPQIKREAKKKPVQPKRIAKKSVPLRSGMTRAPGKMKTPIKYKKVTPKKQKAMKKKIIKKNLATRNPIDIKATKAQEMEIAQGMMKQIVNNLKQTISTKVNRMSESAKENLYHISKLKAKAKSNQFKHKSNNVKKRQVKKPPKKMTRVPVKKPVYKAKGKKPGKSQSNRSRQYVRQRRDVGTAETTHMATSGTRGSSAGSTNTPVSLPVVLVRSYSLEPDDDDSSHAANSTVPENRYYKYNVGSKEPKAKMNESVGNTTSPRFNLTETVFNLIDTQLNLNVSTEKTTKHVINNEASKSVNFTEINYKGNKLKYEKWLDTKLLKEKKMISESDIQHQRFMKWKTHINKTILLEDKKRGFGKIVERKLNNRKHSVVKLLSHPKCKFDNCEINSSLIQISNTDNDDVHGFLTQTLKYDPPKSVSTTHRPKRRRKPSVLRYLKGIFNRIFKGNKKHDNLSKHQLVETLCENFGPCKVKRKDKSLLNSKLADLDKETKRILKTVRIIKGLLKLLDIPKRMNNDTSERNNLRNDIQKLHIILKLNYSDNERVNLTSTQRTQIEYIKRSTQDFIQSVNKFALLISDIITILTKEEANRLKNDSKDHFMNKIKDPFQSLKILLLRYKLVQNKFMKHIYEQLNNFENKINEKPKVSEVKDVNNTVEIETISRNIIQNLRKLKRLAQTVSYSGRTKREIVRDDDAIGYLLMLMEYLVKQNHPLDAEPVNDGIDLLIEAIKSAPDIKPIKKKVLEDVPAPYAHSSTTTIPRTTITTETNKEEDRPEIEKSSDDESDRSNIEVSESKLDENKELVEIVSDDDKEFEDKQFDRRAEPGKTEENTEMSFFRKFENNIIPESDSIFETTTYKNMVVDIESNDKIESPEYTEKTGLIESSDLDKNIEQSDIKGKKRIDMFIGDGYEEVTLPSTETVTETEMPTTLPPEYPTQALKSRTKLLYSDTAVNDNVDSKSKMKWIEENFGKEPEKDILEFQDTNSSLGITPVTAKTTEKTIATIDVSSITKEKENESINKKDADKLSAEEVMFRKQMELLNSLDYGTERQEIYEVDSKDSNVEDRYTGDNFPAYFV